MEQQMTRKITFLGLGAMGSALARAALATNLDVTVWNRTPERADPLVAIGATAAANSTAAIAAADLIVICLLDYPSVRAVLDAAEATLSGKTILNLTNGTPEQARGLAAWAEAEGAAYLDGGIMAIPPMIGGPETLILTSGSAAARAVSHDVLASFGSSRYLSGDPGHAALYDLALLTAMYGMFGGYLQGTALLRADGIAAVDFVEMAQAWLTAMQSSLPEMARQIDAADHGRNVGSNLAMQDAAYINLIDASRARKLSTDLIEPMQRLLQKAVATGRGGHDIASMAELIALD
jgi:3-hydroxyisobutyrate dehydrogenase-like beta-hydroxyacid dehydrogenase